MPTPEEIDALLPQTQCGLCGYGGCLPYAEALADKKAAINLCPPGGVDTLLGLGELLSADPAPYLLDMQLKTKPPMLAIVREKECIGCTKCIQACPVDAIIGSAKEMHTILNDICTGCELCIPACPVDCIDMIHHPHSLPDASLSRTRYQQRQIRLSNKKIKDNTSVTKKTLSLQEKKNFIREAILRANKKKGNVEKKGNIK
jgi:electron transport complex protein RnfB